MRRFAPILSWLPALLLQQAATGQAIVGRVLDETTGTGVTAAHVILLDRTGATRGQSFADSAGWFRLAAPIPGRYRVQASSLGYAPLESVDLNLEKGIELHLELRLSSTAVALEPLRIVARRAYRVGRLAEYYDRAQWTRRTGMGRIFMRDDIDRIRPFSVSSLVRMTPGRLGCQPTYMLDGLPVENETLDSLIHPEDVEGVEIYRGSVQIPAEYMNRASCGLVLVWTRLDAPGMKPFSWKRLLVGVGLGALLIGAATRMD